MGTTAVAGLRGHQIAFDVIANNLSNLNTAGFKVSRATFAEAMQDTQRTNNPNQIADTYSPGAGAASTAIKTDFREGLLIETGDPLNLAILGEGFFAVRLPNNRSGYTRAGNFLMNERRELVTPAGHHLEVRIPSEAVDLAVAEDGTITGELAGIKKTFGRIVAENYAGEIQLDAVGRPVDADGVPLPTALVIPNEAADVTIAADGSIKTVISKEVVDLGLIAVTHFENPNGLISEAGNLFLLSGIPGIAGAERVGVPGQQVAGVELGSIRSHTIESSNVKLESEMVQLLQAQRAYQLTARCLQNGDQMWGLANSIRR